MLLHNLSLAGRKADFQVRIEGDRIRRLTHEEDHFTWNSKGIHLFFQEAIAFPGLINSHDHLDFNLFEQLGNEIYPNYEAWSRNLQLNHQDKINEVLRIPKETRISWGIYKNLLNGFTTVVNHGQKLSIRDKLIRVIQPGQLHSVKFEKHWKWKINRPRFQKIALAIHVGEGTDEAAANEINELIQYNFMRKDLIGIHGVAMQEEQAAAFRSLVWCPASNYFMFNQTAPIDRLHVYTKVVFGTDSTLTAPWNAWDHFRMARKSKLVNDEKLFQLLTTEPASLWGLEELGSLEVGMQADLVIAKKNPLFQGWDAFYAINPADILVVIQEGSIRLIDDSLVEQLRNHESTLKDFSRIYIGEALKWVQGRLPELIESIKRHQPGIRLPVSA
jgi:cytosine/adenosine deaminase-related metal-dependent hydrolase